jgi:D-amino peptidase
VVHPDRIAAGTPAHARAARALTRDVAAALEGAFTAGASEALVFDLHDDGHNVDASALPGRTSLVSGRPRPTPDFPMGLDDSFGVVFLVGARAVGGTENALMPGCSLGPWDWCEVNSRRLGDIGLAAAIAAPLGAPVALVSGGAAAVAEAREMLGDGLPTVSVKSCVGDGGALCRSGADTAASLQAAGEKAVRSAADRPHLLFPDPVRITGVRADGEVVGRGKGSTALEAYVDLWRRL